MIWTTGLSQQSYIRPADEDVVADSTLYPKVPYVKVVSYSFNRGTPLERQLDSLERQSHEIKKMGLWSDDLEEKVMDTAIDWMHQLDGSRAKAIYQPQGFASYSKAMGTLEKPNLEYLRNIMSRPLGIKIQTEACSPIFRDALVFYNTKEEIVGTINISFACHVMETGEGERFYFTFPQWEKLILFFKNTLAHPVKLQLHSYIRPLGIEVSQDSVQVPAKPYSKVISYSLNRVSPLHKRRDSLNQEFLRKEKEGYWSDRPKEKEEAEFEIFALSQQSIYNEEDYIYKDGKWAYTAQKIKELTLAEIEKVMELVIQPPPPKMIKTVSVNGCEPVFRDALVFFNEKDEVVGTLEICFTCWEMKSGDQYLRFEENGFWDGLGIFFREELGHPVEK